LYCFGLIKFIDDNFISCIINTKTKKEKHNMKNVKTLLIFITISTFIFASGTRVASLGGNAGFWADDYANIGAFPASVNNHNVAWTDGSNFTSVWNDDGTTWGFSGGAANDLVNMMWGNGEMGVSVGLGMVPDNEATTTDEAETTYNVGFGMPLAGMDFGGTFDGDMVGVNLRRSQDVPPFWDNVLVGFGMTLEDKDTDQSADIGLGVHAYNNRSYDNGTSSLFALGIDYDDDGKDPTTGTVDPDAIINLIWTFAVESEMTDWATLRVGYNRAHDLGGGANSDGVVSMGLGFNYESFNLDMNLLSFSTMLNDPVVYMTGRNAAPLGNGFTISYNW